MNPRSNPVFPFPHGELQFTGISVRDLARIVALHGLLVGGTDLDPTEAADYAMKTADTLFPEPPNREPPVFASELFEAAVRDAVKRSDAKRSWRFW